MRIFLTRWFVRFARRERIGSRELREAISRATRGAIDADLGGHVIKQRVARPRQGRSGGYRAIIVIRLGDRAFFVYGFAKSERDNLAPDEEKAYKTAAKDLLGLDGRAIASLLAEGALKELDEDG